MGFHADLRTPPGYRETPPDRWASSGFQRREAQSSNAVLASLSAEAIALLNPQLGRFSVAAGEILLSAGDLVDEVFFLEAGLAKISTPLASGDAAPATLIGRDGVVGLGSAISGQPGQATASVLIAGSGWRLSAVGLRRLFSARPDLCQPLIHCLALQVSELQMEAACNAHHTVEQRLAKLLLAARARLDADIVPVTQEDIATMLGVRRPTVSTIARRLKVRGALTYLRGAIRIADLGRLEAVACGCNLDVDREATFPVVCAASAARA